MNFNQSIKGKIILIIIFIFSLTLYSCGELAKPPTKPTLSYKEAPFKYNLKNKLYSYKTKDAWERKSDKKMTSYTIRVVTLKVKYKKNKPAYVILERDLRSYFLTNKSTLINFSTSTYKVDRTSKTELEIHMISMVHKLGGKYIGPNKSNIKKWDNNPSNFVYNKTVKISGAKIDPNLKHSIFTVKKKGKEIKMLGFINATFLLQK